MSKRGEATPSGITKQPAIDATSPTMREATTRNLLAYGLAATAPAFQISKVESMTVSFGTRTSAGSRRCTNMSTSFWLNRREVTTQVRPAPGSVATSLTDCENVVFGDTDEVTRTTGSSTRGSSAAATKSAGMRNDTTPDCQVIGSSSRRFLASKATAFW
ncbi:MAG: hypothetical protein MUC36_23305 [Planctomycetes bacterium]|nr:hypothetical protein [Planctomycetota bacterium]